MLRGIRIGRLEGIRGDLFTPIRAVAIRVLAGVAAGVVAAVTPIANQQRQRLPVTRVSGQVEALDIDPLNPISRADAESRPSARSRRPPSAAWSRQDADCILEG